MSNTQLTPAAAIDGVCYLYPPETSADFKAGWALALQMAKANMCAGLAGAVIPAHAQPKAAVDELFRAITDLSTFQAMLPAAQYQLALDAILGRFRMATQAIDNYLVASPADPA